MIIIYKIFKKIIFYFLNHGVAWAMESVQALKLELPMFKNHFNSQSLKDSVENMINAKDCLK